MVSELKWTTVTNNEVASAKYRLDASVFNIDAKKAKEDLANSKWSLRPLCGEEGIASAFHRGRFKRIFVKKSHLPIFQPSQITDIFPKPYLYISELTNTNINALRISENQILMTCSGTIGKCTIVSKRLNNQIFSHDLLRITAKEPEDSGFIYAFLKSETGQLVTITNNYGAVIQHIEPEHLENISIPYPDKDLRKSIHDKIVLSFLLRDESNELIEKAENLLISSLNLPSIDKLELSFFKRDAGFQNYSVSTSLLDDRLDASYHIPLVNAIIDNLLDNAETILPLGHENITSKIILPGRFKRVYVGPGEGVVFLGGKQINELDPSNKKFLSLKQHGSRIDSQLFLKENMIAITCSGTIGKVNIIPKHWENWTMSQHVIRAVPQDITIAGYLFIWLNSDYGKALIKRFTYGSVVDEIDHRHLAKIPIPILHDKGLIKEINELALKANKLRAEAYYLEQKAIQQINDEVIFSQKGF